MGWLRSLSARLCTPFQKRARRAHFAAGRRCLRAFKAVNGTAQEERHWQSACALTAQTPPAVTAIDRWAVGKSCAPALQAWLHQSLIQRNLAADLMRALMEHHGGCGRPLRLPLPAEWRRAFRAAGIPIAPWACRFRMAREAVVSLLRAVRRAQRLGTRRDEWLIPAHAPYAMSMGLSRKMPPHADDRACTLGNWYRQRQLAKGRAHIGLYPRQPAANTLPTDCHYVDWPWPRLPAAASGGFLLAAAAIVTRAAAALLAGRWAAAWAAPSAVEAAYVERLPPDVLAREYQFIVSDYILRPLWTYVAERQGAEVALLFYSTNCRLLRHAGAAPLPPPVGYSTMSWPHYRVWDKWQQQWLTEMGHGASAFEQVGPVPLEDQYEPLDGLDPRAVAVFDVEAYSWKTVASKGWLTSYYSADTINAFLDDIHQAARQAGVPIAYKSKRHLFVAKLDQRYKDKLSSLEREELFISISPTVSALRLVEQCNAVISLPFTSTASVGRAAGKPSIYYDPTGTLSGGDDAHGIPILTTAQQLADWLRETHGRAA